MLEFPHLDRRQTRGALHEAGPLEQCRFGVDRTLFRGLARAQGKAIRRARESFRARRKAPADCRSESSTECCRGRSAAASSSQPANASPSNGKSRLGTRACRRCAANSLSIARDFWNSVRGSNEHSFNLCVERCEAGSNRRMDSISSPKNSMRTGSVILGREHIEDAATQRVLAHHLDRIAAAHNRRCPDAAAIRPKEVRRPRAASASTADSATARPASAKPRRQAAP